MGKLSSYIMLMSGIIIVFYALGIIENTFTSVILDLLFNPSTAETSSLFGFLTQSGTGFVALALGIVVTAIVQVTKNDFMIIAPIVLVLANFGYDFLVIIQTFIAATDLILGLLLFSPLVILYFFTIIEWWRGITTW